MKTVEIKLLKKKKPTTMVKGDWIRVVENPKGVKPFYKDIRFFQKALDSALRIAGIPNKVEEAPKISKEEFKRLLKLGIFAYLPDNKNRYVKRYYLK
jgi:5-bromo-4-chloroindolyl phosphate hydrolysis protein